MILKRTLLVSLPRKKKWCINIANIFVFYTPPLPNLTLSSLYDTIYNLYNTDFYKTSVSEHLKEFKTQFDLILEGEKHVDHARTAVELCDQRECKLKKEVKKAKKCTAEEMQDLEKRLYEAARAKEVAQLEGKGILSLIFKLSF